MHARAQSQEVLPDDHTIAELAGIQLLLMNTLGPIARGEQMAPEQIDLAFRQVQTRTIRCIGERVGPILS